MKSRYLFLFALFCLNTAWADFSNTDVWHHPRYFNANEPYVIDIRGEWSTDCHPGEQKPVISEYTGDSVLIEFETIVEHVTCNEVVTPYRVLVDMSDVIDTVIGEFPLIDVTIRFRGSEYVQAINGHCMLCGSPPPPPRDIKPEAGLYHSDGLEKQGLLLARQNQRMAAYPLIYDESGSSEWVFGPGGMVEDVFFSTLYELTGGQCLGCPPPDDPPESIEVGKLTLLMDGQGLVQMKVNDGLFMSYEYSEFGYGSRDVGGHPRQRIPDLSGRWAFVNIGKKPPQGTLEDERFIPLVFDIRLESVTVVEPPIVGTPPPTLAGNVKFSIRDMDANELVQMQCDYGSDLDNVYNAEMVCKVNNSDVNGGDTMYEVKPLSVERLSVDWVGPIIPEIPTRTEIAVRID